MLTKKKRSVATRYGGAELLKKKNKFAQMAQLFELQAAFSTGERGSAAVYDCSPLSSTLADAF